MVQFLAKPLTCSRPTTHHHSQSRINGLAMTACILLITQAIAVPVRAEAKERPNIVFILADDLGYGDVKCFGGDQCQIETPGFDRLAAEGMRFTDAHANASVCVPTRVAIMTGKYPWRFPPPQRGGPWGFLGPQFGPEQHTLGKMLQSAGYRTGYVGKWHLGTRMQTKDGKTQGPTNVDYTKPLTHGPAQFGFDHSFILPGSLDMYPYVFARNNMWVGNVTKQRGWSAFNRIGPCEDDFEDTKVLDTFCVEAEQFIAGAAAKSGGDSTKAEQPFFLFLALTAPHTPTSPSEKFRGKSKLGIYGDFVMETDDCVARMLKALDEHGLSNDTLVIATSDHGPAPYAGRTAKATFDQLKDLKKDGHDSKAGYRGYKFSVYEGGLRVPFVARWPGSVPPQSTCDRLIGLPDMMATFAAVAGVDLEDAQAPDSFSIVPLLNNPDAEPVREDMILEGTRGFVMRDGKFKLALCPGSGSEGRWGNAPKSQASWRTALDKHGRRPKNHDELITAPFVQLFDLNKDPKESNNLASSQQAKVNALHSKLTKQMQAGRTRPGDPLPNVRKNLKPFKSVPEFIWKAAPPPNPAINIKQTNDHIVATFDGKPVLRYNKAVQDAPEGIDAVFARSGYIHPIYSPSGLEVSGDFPPDHAHQHALFNAWTSTTFEGRKVDFWNQKKGLGRVSHNDVIEIGPDYFEVEMLHEDLTSEEGPKPVLTETWRVHLRGIDDKAYVFDITSTQTCVADSPLKMNQYRYGGMGIRGNNQWIRAEGTAALSQFQKEKQKTPNKEVAYPALETVRHRFTTSEGHRRFVGNHSRPNWVDLSGLIDGKLAGVSIIGHRKNFRSPQPVRLHPTKPYFCFAPMVIGEFEIAPGEKFVSRFRYIVHDDDFSADTIQRQSQSFR